MTVTVRDKSGFIEYDNLFESRAENGDPELTQSRGRVREIALGYFGREETANRLAKQFREYLNSLPAAPAPVTPPAAPVRDQAQSGA